MFELCAFSSNSSSLSHNLHKKKPLDEVWLLPLISWFSYTSFFSFRSVTEFRSPPQLQMCHRFHHGSMKRSTIPPLWHFPNSTEPSEAYCWHHVLKHGQEESCPRTFLGWKSVRQKADFYLLPCWILGSLTLSAPSCGADLPQPPYTQRISVVLALASSE